MSKKITDYSALTSVATGDLVEIVDISDTTDGVDGSSKKIAVSDLTALKADATHTHAESDVTNLTTDLAAKLVKASNLSDLASATTARTNLGLGTLATQSGTFSGTSSGTNTGDQTLPTNAAGTDLDTATDTTKFATAKAIKDAHNVPSVAPGTSGNVLTSNGTDWTSAAAAGGGGGGLPSRADVYAFYAQVSGSPATSSSDALVPFSVEVYDPGSAYDPSTYQYTAPVTGLYHFECQVAASAAMGSSDRLTLDINNFTTYYQFPWYGTTNKRLRLSIETVLTAGDVVDICMAISGTLTIDSAANNTWLKGHLVAT